MTKKEATSVTATAAITTSYLKLKEGALHITMAQTSMTSFFGGNSSSSKGSKKRERDGEEHDQTAAKKRSKAASKIVLVTAPGAGGKTSKHAIQLFQELHTRCGIKVCRMDETEPVHWNKFTPSNKKNMNAILAAVKRVSKAHPDKRILLVGYSFGCRVVAEAMRTLRTELKEANVVDAMICQGYPLLKSGVPATDANNVKRAAHLEQLPSSVKTLVVQGERDSFLGPRGMASLQELLDGMNDTHDFTLVQVPKCGHDVSAKAVPQMREAIVDFANTLVDDE